VPDLEAPAATALRANLVSFAEWSQMLAKGERRSFALVREPALGIVDALLSWRYSAVEGDLYADYLALAAAQRSTETVELINQRIEEYRVPSGRAIAIHDFLVIREGGVLQPARERCTVAVFPDNASVLIELHIATMDLALFDDLVAYAIALVSGERPALPGRLEYRG
jgi:hypothetical protein